MAVERDATDDVFPGKRPGGPGGQDADGHSMMPVANGTGELVSPERRLRYLEIGRRKLQEFREAQARERTRGPPAPVPEGPPADGRAALRQHEEALQQALQQIADLTAALEERDGHLRRLSDELQQWHDQWQALAQEMANLQAAVAERDAALAALQADLDRHREAAAAVRTQSRQELEGEVQDEVFRLQEELSGARERVAQLAAEGAALAGQVEHERSQKEAYRGLVEDRDRLLEQLSGQAAPREDHEREVSDLRLRLERAGEGR